MGRWGRVVPVIWQQAVHPGLRLPTMLHWEVTYTNIPATWTASVLIVKQVAGKRQKRNWVLLSGLYYKVCSLTCNRTIFLHQCLCQPRKRQDSALGSGRAYPSIISDVLVDSTPPTSTPTFPKSHQNKWGATLWPPAGKNSNCDCLPRKPTEIAPGSVTLTSWNPSRLFQSGGFRAATPDTSIEILVDVCAWHTTPAVQLLLPGTDRRRHHSPWQKSHTKG